jgi:hypothetical protein
MLSRERWWRPICAFTVNIFHNIFLEKHQIGVINRRKHHDR